MAMSSTSVAATHHSVIESCQYQYSKAVVKRFRCREDPRSFQRWHREAEALKLVRAHDNITKLFESDPVALTITLRHEPGRSLDLHIDLATQKCTLSPEAAHELWKQMSGALAYVHYRSIVHNDVKPGNIIWDEHSKRAVLMDFGAALVDPNPSTLPYRGWTPSGTLPHAPPEFMGKVKGKPADVFALGATMLFAFGHISLPDGAWMIPHVFENGVREELMMSRLTKFEFRRRSLEFEDPNSLLVQMLEWDLDARITSDELSRRLT